MKRIRPYLILSVLALASAIPAFAVDVTLLGPATYTRERGTPVVRTASFPGSPGQATLQISNGNPAGDHRVSSAVIQLNGLTVADVDTFNQNVDSLTLDVTLQEQNTLTVELRSAPQSFLRLKVTQQVLAAAAAVLGPEGGILTVLDQTSALLGLSLQLPANALPRPTLVRIRNAPAVPLRANPEKEEIAALPPFEIEPSMPLAANAIISIPYADADSDGIVDGTGLPADSAAIYYLSPDDGESLIRVRTYVSETDHRINASTSHFSTWYPFLSRWKWGSNVTYFVDSMPVNELSPDKTTFRSELKDALKQWSVAVYGAVTFEEVFNSTAADFTVWAKDFCQAYPSDPDCSKTPALVVRAIDYSGYTGIPERLEFNSGPENSRPRRWLTGPYDSFPPPCGSTDPYIFVPFLRLALHEGGHLTRLKDENTIDNWTPTDWNGAIMAYDELNGDPWFCTDGFPYLRLRYRDLVAIRTLYGAAFSFVSSYSDLLKYDTLADVCHFDDIPVGSYGNQFSSHSLTFFHQYGHLEVVPGTYGPLTFPPRSPRNVLVETGLQMALEFITIETSVADARGIGFWLISRPGATFYVQVYDADWNSVAAIETGPGFVGVRGPLGRNRVVVKSYGAGYALDDVSVVH